MKYKKLSLILFSVFFFLFFLSLAFAQESETEPVQTEEETSSENVTLDFKDADVRSVLRVISYKSGINIVATPEVIGAVTIRLQDVHWEKALDTIVRTYGFGYEWLNDKVIMVSTLEKLAEQRRVRDEAAQKEPLDTQAFPLSFAKVEDVKIAIEKLVSDRGKVTLEVRANTLIVTDTKSNLIKIEKIIKSLDKITPQVMIEAKLIETTLGDSEKLGIDWSMRVSASGSARPTTFPFTGPITGTGSKMFPKVKVPSELERVTTTVYDDEGNPISSSTEEKLWNSLEAGFPAVCADKFLFGTLNFTEVQAILEILNSSSETNIVSNPRITTLNNQEAKIIIGTVVPIPTYEYSKDTGTRQITGYFEEEVGIKLIVTPNINQQDYITLDIKPSVDAITAWTGPDNERPIISTRSAETKVMVKNGETLVIGGLISERKIDSRKRVPILGYLPILDFLFSKKEDVLDKTDLMIFITPRIVEEAKLSPEEAAKL